MILTIIGLPLLGAILLTFSTFAVSESVTGRQKSSNNIYKIRQMALLFTCATYLSSVVIWINFDSTTTDMQFTQSITNWSVGSLQFGVDSLSVFFILLTTVTMPVVILSGFYINAKQARFYLILILLFEAFILIVFTSLDLVLFYVSFEAVLIPLCLLTGMYGGIRRVLAAYLLFIYTLVGSLPMLLSILKIYNMTGLTHISTLTIIINIENMSNIQFDHTADFSYVWLGLFLALAIKAPIAPFHLWLRVVHSEGNTATSIILAGLVLKIATYGFMRILIGIFPSESAYFAPLVITLALVSIIYTSFSCMRQTDFKQLVAYSSVAHMSVAILGLFSNTVLGISGGVILSLSHGFTSPALFFLLGGVVYDRYHTRVIRYYRGLSIYMPMFSAFFFFFSLANSGTPLTSNWVGEFLSLAGAMQNYPYITALASTSIFFSAVYSIYLFNRISFGQFSSYLVPVLDITRQEFHVIFPLTFFTLLLGIWPNLVLDVIQISMSSLIYNTLNVLSPFL